MDRTPTGASSAGELSTLRTQIEELARRVTHIADRYADTPDSQIASDLFAAERALLAARRSLERASDSVGG